jgi:uncharacterized membrane protein
VRIAKKAKLILSAALLSVVAAPRVIQGQARPPQPTKKQPAGPPVSQSTHYPILLLAFGNNPDWSLRIGLKGPERLDRPNYPPIPLEPATVVPEAAADSWTYQAKDSATGAAVSVHLAREVCTDVVSDPTAAPGPSTGKYTFRVSVDHSQLGSMKGCARIAAELFPKINNQLDSEDEADKNKPPPPTITKFQRPVAIAYSTAAGKVVFKRGAITRAIATESHQLSVSHDGSRLLFTREDQDGNRAIILYDFATEKSTELLHGSVQEAFWSPDDTRFAFMKSLDGKWHLWAAPIASPENALSVYPGEITSIHGWVDAHTILVEDLQQLSWIGDDGTTKQTLSEKDVLGDSFGSSSDNSVRVHPLNSDLLLIAAQWLKPPQGVPVDQHRGGGAGFFLYEIRSKRRVILSPLNMFAQYAEWSRDGLQIFFTGTDSARHSYAYRMFWDGTGLQKFASGIRLVIGQ